MSVWARATVVLGFASVGALVGAALLQNGVGPASTIPAAATGTAAFGYAVSLTADLFLARSTSHRFRVWRATADVSVGALALIAIVGFVGAALHEMEGDSTGYFRSTHDLIVAFARAAVGASLAWVGAMVGASRASR